LRDGDETADRSAGGAARRLGRFGWLWIVATPAFLLWAAATVDFGILTTTVQRLSVGAAAASVGLLVVNLALEALWLRVILGGALRPPPAEAVIGIAAWHAFAVTVLPGRAGDLLWVALIRKRAGLTTTHAAVLALMHRIQDVIALAALFCGALALASRDIVGADVALAAAGLLPLALLSQAGLGRILGAAARLVLAASRRTRFARLKGVARQLIQVRRWRRREVGTLRGIAAFAIIALRWLVVGAALYLPLAALADGLAFGDGSLIVSAYVLLGMIPLQTIGGYGAGEAGLASLLTGFGLSLAAGAAIALALRTLINLGNLCGWALGLAALAGRRAVRR